MSTCRGPHDRLHVPHRASACFACSGGAKYPVQLGPGPQQRPSNRLRFRAKGNGAAPSGCRATPDPVRGHAQPGRTRFFVWPGSRVWSRCEFARSLPHSRARWEVADLVRCGVSGHCSELAGFEQIADYVRTAEGDQPRERESAMPDTLVLTDFVLIDGTGRAPAVGSSVFVEEGHIVAVGENRRRPLGVRVIEGRGRWLLPGLWDTHIHHVFAGGGFVWAEEFSDQQRKWSWRGCLRSGVTSVVSVGDDKEIMQARSDAPGAFRLSRTVVLVARAQRGCPATPLGAVGASRGTRPRARRTPGVGHGRRQPCDLPWPSRAPRTRASGACRADTHAGPERSDLCRSDEGRRAGHARNCRTGQRRRPPDTRSGPTEGHREHPPDRPRRQAWSTLRSSRPTGAITLCRASAWKHGMKPTRSSARVGVRARTAASAGSSLARTQPVPGQGLAESVPRYRQRVRVKLGFTSSEASRPKRPLQTFVGAGLYPSVAGGSRSLGGIPQSGEGALREARGPCQNPRSLLRRASPKRRDAAACTSSTASKGEAAPRPTFTVR
jgi:hypothetical protein